MVSWFKGFVGDDKSGNAGQIDLLSALQCGFVRQEGLLLHIALQFLHEFYELLRDERMSLVRGVQAVISDIHGFRRIGVFIRGGVEGDRYVVRIGVVAISAGLRVFEALVANKVGNGHAFVVVEIDDAQVFITTDVDDGFGHLFQGLSVLFLIGAPGIVLWIADVDEVGARHGCNKNDGGDVVKTVQFVDDDPKTAVDGTVAGGPVKVKPGTDVVALPPVVGAQEHCVDVTHRNAQSVNGPGKIAGGPAVAALVVIMDIGQPLGNVGEIAFGDVVLGFVEVLVEIGDAVADGHPGDGVMGKGCQDKDRGQEEEAHELFHICHLVKNSGYLDQPPFPLMRFLFIGPAFCLLPSDPALRPAPCRPANGDSRLNKALFREKSESTHFRYGRPNPY